MELIINSGLIYNSFLTVRYLIKCLTVTFFAIFIIGCNAKNNTPIESINEVVMTPGMAITVENTNGQLTITAGENFQRSFTWAGDTRSVNMWPRKKRWNGSLGIYYPGPGNHWAEHDGITRADLEEGQLHFDSLDDIVSFIRRYEDDGSYTYNDTGLFVSWKKNPGAGGTLQVTIWQFLVKGQSPSRIPGSKNDKIIIKYP